MNQGKDALGEEGRDEEAEDNPCRHMVLAMHLSTQTVNGTMLFHFPPEIKVKMFHSEDGGGGNSGPVGGVDQL
jgi:hypothetical protein